MSRIELQYRIVPPPNSELLCASPTNNGESPTGNDAASMYQFQKTGLNKVNFEVPYSYTFFEEKSVNGCPKHLKVYLLGFDGCDQLFLKYSENVECIDFYGCFTNPEVCFRICAQLKRLKEIRFNISGNKILDDGPAPRSVASWNGLKNSQIMTLNILVNSTNLGNRSARCQDMINRYVEILLEYSKGQLPNIRKLNLELPDTDNILSLTRSFLRSTSFKKPNILITLGESIKITHDAKLGSQSPLEPTHSGPNRPSKSKKATSPDSSANGSNGTSTNRAATTNNVSQNSSQTSSNAGSSKQSEIRQSSSQTAPSTKPTIPISTATNNVYSYAMSTTERLLRESAAQMDRKNALIAQRKESQDKLEAERQAEARQPRTESFTGKAERASPTFCGSSEACNPTDSLSDIASGSNYSQLSKETTTVPGTTDENTGEERFAQMERDDIPMPPSIPTAGSRRWSVSADENESAPRNKFAREREMHRDRDDHHRDRKYSRSRSPEEGLRSQRSTSPRQDRSPYRRRGEKYSPGSYYPNENTSFDNHSRARGGPNRIFRGRPNQRSRSRGRGGGGYHTGYNNHAKYN